LQQPTPDPMFTVEGGHLVMYRPDKTGLPQVKDATVNDRDRMQDLLAQEKYLTAAYNVAINEAGHEALCQVIEQNWQTCHQIQRQLFHTMFQKGWYKLPVADGASVSQTYTQFKGYQGQLPFPPGQQPSTPARQAVKAQPANPADRALKQAVERALHDAVEQNWATGVTPSNAH
jgi:hypothetical protein